MADDGGKVDCVMIGADEDGVEAPDIVRRELDARLSGELHVLARARDQGDMGIMI